MSISSREFKAIAKKLSAIRPIQGGIDKVQENYNRGKWSMWAEVVDELGNCFIDANPKFNKNTFVEACND